MTPHTTRSPRALALSICAVALLSLAPALADPTTDPATDPATLDPALRAQVVKLFNGYERHPTREDLLQVAPEESLVLALHDLYQDASARPYVRTNALAALALFPSDVTYSLLLDALTDPATSATARRAVIQALAGGFGPRAADDIARVGLAHDDLHTRRVTAQALLKAATPTALAALEARLDVEAHPLVRADLARALAAWPPSASPLAPTPARVTTQDAPPAKR